MNAHGGGGGGGGGRNRCLFLAFLGCAALFSCTHLFTRYRTNNETASETNFRESSVVTTAQASTAAIANATIQAYAGETVVIKPKSTLNTFVVDWEGLQGVESLMYRYWTGNLFCETINNVRKKAANASLPITLNISFGCLELFEKGVVGTGNYISALYGMRLAAQRYKNVDIHFTCSDAETTKKELILPWLTGWFPPRQQGSKSRFPKGRRNQACGRYGQNPTGLMYNEMQYDFRRMAIGLVGVPRPDHPSAQFAEKYLWSKRKGVYDESTSVLQLSIPQKTGDPVFPRGSVELDDAVIHFRCGDLMTSDHPYFGMLKFKGYAKYISSEVRTIGIVTQPFDGNVQTARLVDTNPTSLDRCRVIVMSLVDYIQERFPSSRIRIHNGPNETVALAYARMIMANQTIAGVSTFGVFPTLASFGTGYFRLPEYPRGAGGFNTWLLDPPIDRLAGNVVLEREENTYMVAVAIRELWEGRGEEAVLEWFRNDDMESK